MVPSSQIIYRVVQPPGIGIRILLTSSNQTSSNSNAQSNLLEFSQWQINEGQVLLEHTPLDDAKRWEVIGLQVEDGQRGNSAQNAGH
jgi:hypothetical protein